jgi:hypothetical protein
MTPCDFQDWCEIGRERKRYSNASKKESVPQEYNLKGRKELKLEMDFPKREGTLKAGR